MSFKKPFDSERRDINDISEKEEVVNLSQTSICLIRIICPSESLNDGFDLPDNLIMKRSARYICQVKISLKTSVITILKLRIFCNGHQELVIFSTEN